MYSRIVEELILEFKKTGIKSNRRYNLKILGKSMYSDLLKNRICLRQALIMIRINDANKRQTNPNA